MANISFNREIIPDLSKAKQLIGETSPTIRKGVENSVAVAEETGSEKYINSAHNMAEAAQKLMKCGEELEETYGSLLNHYKRLEDAL